MSSTLTAISPLDGRYQEKVSTLAPFVSEFALIRYRVQIEVAWLKALAAAADLAEVPPFSAETQHRLDALLSAFDTADAKAVKAIEARTNHDVKAIEYWLKEKLADCDEVSAVAEFIHFACTSEDINNLCYALMARDCRDRVLLPALDRI